MYFLVVVQVLLRFPHRQSELVVPLGIVSIACISKQRIIKHTEQLQITNIVCLTNYRKLYSSFFTIANLPWASCLINQQYIFKWTDKVLISVDMNTTYVESSKTCFLGSSTTFDSSCGFSFFSGATFSTLIDSCFTFNFVDFFKHFPILF